MSAKPRRTISPPSYPSSATVSIPRLRASSSAATTFFDPPLVESANATSSGRACAIELAHEDQVGADVVGDRGKEAGSRRAKSPGSARISRVAMHAIEREIRRVGCRAAVAEGSAIVRRASSRARDRARPQRRSSRPLRLRRPARADARRRVLSRRSTPPRRRRSAAGSSALRCPETDRESPTRRRRVAESRSCSKKTCTVSYSVWPSSSKSFLVHVRIGARRGDRVVGLRAGQRDRVCPASARERSARSIRRSPSGGPNAIAISSAQTSASTNASGAAAHVERRQRALADDHRMNELDRDVSGVGRVRAAAEREQTAAAREPLRQSVRCARERAVLRARKTAA